MHICFSKHLKLLQTATSFQFGETLETHTTAARQKPTALLTAHADARTCCTTKHSQSTATAAIGRTAIVHAFARHVTAAKAHTTATPDALQGAPLELL